MLTGTVGGICRLKSFRGWRLLLRRMPLRLPQFRLTPFFQLLQSLQAISFDLLL